MAFNFRHQSPAKMAAVSLFVIVCLKLWSFMPGGNCAAVNNRLGNFGVKLLLKSFKYSVDKARDLLELFNLQKGRRGKSLLFMFERRVQGPTRVLLVFSFVFHQPCRRDEGFSNDQ